MKSERLFSRGCHLLNIHFENTYPTLKMLRNSWTFILSTFFWVFFFRKYAKYRKMHSYSWSRNQKKTIRLLVRISPKSNHAIFERNTNNICKKKWKKIKSYILSRPVLETSSTWPHGLGVCGATNKKVKVAIYLSGVS